MFIVTGYVCHSSIFKSNNWWKANWIPIGWLISVLSIPALTNKKIFFCLFLWKVFLLGVSYKDSW
jgi:hypothetical protein